MSRNGPLLLAEAAAELIPSAQFVADQPLLLAWEGREVVGYVEIPPELVRGDTGIVPVVQILAAGYGSSDLVAAIARENAEALRSARNLLGVDLDLRDAAWHLDRGRLTFSLLVEPDATAERSRERLAEYFHTEIRFSWPGGEDRVDLGSAPE